MPVYRLPDDNYQLFPHPAEAESNGLIAVSRDLHEQRLIGAYANGLFPWFEEDGYFYWYTPDPRWVLKPADLCIHKSMRSVFNQHKFRYTFDTAFEQVMQGCAETPRYGGQSGTWITTAFCDAYTNLHREGLAHSVEVWQDEELVGGLYGISLGKMFFGESMFARVTNASKAGFITLVKALEKAGYWLIDCQQQTAHLESLGARGISRELFYEYLLKNAYERTVAGRWHYASDTTLEIHPLAGTH
ncbi:MAG TPA: leucyl/phenylalanyl-tRNA--protein transferase [Saprospiraceae bacterium]|nr:leucyl/phenylalanyl-tRNA--protein transferase [Saprospiraceae bacterium]HPI06864.1 leucyl/phenylalanyl-tRNA--protein transferase [Saprospiraceae bacterium]